MDIFIFQSIFCTYSNLMTSSCFLKITGFPVFLVKAKYGQNSEGPTICSVVGPYYVLILRHRRSDPE